jgi:hypothetical protein
LKGILPENHIFKVENGSFFSKYICSAKLNKHRYLSKENHVLEAGGSSTLSPGEN